MYRLVGRLETSELSDLYRADRDGESVVVKLFPDRTTDVAYAKTMVEISQRLRAVKHPGVIHVLDVGLVKKGLAIVREDKGKYAMGTALHRLHSREAFLPAAVALGFTIDLLEVLGAAHDKGVLHGAVTPGNVMLSADGSAALADFGARSALQACPALMQTFGNRGRLSYRPPDQRLSEPDAIEADIYAVGAMAYELLTLREASTGSKAVSTRREKLPPPSRLVRQLNHRLDPVIMRALEPSASRRFKSCHDFAEGLRDVLVATGGVPRRDDVRKFIDELFPKDMVIEGLGPVPFTEPFGLDDIKGVPELKEVSGVTGPLGLRPSFSGGEVDDRTPTSDGLPVFREDGSLPPSPADTLPLPPVAPERDARETVQDLPVPKSSGPVPQVDQWHAPEGPMPEARGAAAPPPKNFDRRVRAQEDFAPSDDEDRGPALKPDTTPVMPSQGKKTVVNWHTPFKQSHWGTRVHLSKFLERGAKRARLAAVIGTVVLVTAIILVTMGAVADWRPDVKGQVERSLSELAGTKPGGTPDSPLTKPPRVSPLKPKDAPKVVGPPPTPKADPDCYQVSRLGAGYLTIATRRGVRVEVDGLHVCGSISKIPVAPGSRTVRVVDTKTGRDYVSTLRFKAGKTVKLTPVFNR